MNRILCATLLTTAASFVVPAFAQADFPNKPVTLVTAFPPGSGPDAVLRLVAEKLGKTWNQRVLVENKPGGGGFIAIDGVKRAAPDGYTLLQLDSEHLAALPHLYKSRNFVTLQTFEPVASLFRTPFIVAVASRLEMEVDDRPARGCESRPGQVSVRLMGRRQPGPPRRASSSNGS